jgi:hypothetical protein
MTAHYAIADEIRSEIKLGTLEIYVRHEVWGTIGCNTL